MHYRLDEFPPKATQLIEVVKTYPTDGIIVKELLALVKEEVRAVLDKREEIERRARMFSKASDRNTFIEFWTAWSIDGPLEELLKKQQRLQALYNLYFNKNKKVGGVTPEMIDAAKAVPLDTLMEFNRQDKAICPFHDEKTPSFRYNREHNFAYCFGACARAYDSIDIIRERDGLGFVDAVKSLSNGV